MAWACPGTTGKRDLRADRVLHERGSHPDLVRASRKPGATGPETRAAPSARSRCVCRQKSPGQRGTGRSHLVRIDMEELIQWGCDPRAGCVQVVSVTRLLFPDVEIVDEKASPATPPPARSAGADSPRPCSDLM